VPRVLAAIEEDNVSRVGRNPVQIPKGVEVKLAGRTVMAKSKLGERQYEFGDQVEVTIEDDKLVVKPRGDDKTARTVWGTTRSHLQGLVKGLTDGFRVDLEIIGVGYRAAVEKNNLALQLGYSHDVRFPIPTGITIKCEKPTLISITGANKQQVGLVAAKIRGYRKPEPYKGKGIRYAGEAVREKEGKKK
jgi:large subunit ribosomal protein L6